MPDTPPLPLNCTTREAGLIAIGELAVTRRLPTTRTPHPLPRGAKIDLSLVPSAMEQLAASWKKGSVRG